MPPVRLIYFDAPTRGEQLRLLFHLTETPFEDVRVPLRGLGAYKQAELGDASPLAFDQVPCIQHGELSIVQTAACMAYIGAHVGLAPTSEEDRARAMMAVLASEEMRKQLFYGNRTVLVVDALLERVGLRRVLNPVFAALQRLYRLRRRRKFVTWCDRWERLLRARGGPYVLGEQLSYADVAVFDCLSAIGDIGCFSVEELESSHPRVNALVADLASRPTLKAYLDARGPVSFRQVRL